MCYKLKVMWFIWLIWHEKGKFALSCQIKKYLAWWVTIFVAIGAATGGFYHYHATCQTCQMFLKLFASNDGGGYTDNPSQLSGMLYIPPQERLSWTQ